MAKKERLAIVGNARESAAIRSLRIDGSCNGATLRTRVIKNKKLYNRNFKHKKSFADAGDFPFIKASLCDPSPISGRTLFRGDFSALTLRHFPLFCILP